MCACVQSPDGKLIASGAIDGIINVFDLESGHLLHTLEGTRIRTYVRTYMHVCAWVNTYTYTVEVKVA